MKQIARKFFYAIICVVISSLNSVAFANPVLSRDSGVLGIFESIVEFIMGDKISGYSDEFFFMSLAIIIAILVLILIILKFKCKDKLTKNTLIIAIIIIIVFFLFFRYFLFKEYQHEKDHKKEIVTYENERNYRMKHATDFVYKYEGYNRTSKDVKKLCQEINNYSIIIENHFGSVFGLDAIYDVNAEPILTKQYPVVNKYENPKLKNTVFDTSTIEDDKYYSILITGYSTFESVSTIIIYQQNEYFDD